MKTNQATEAAISQYKDSYNSALLQAPTLNARKVLALKLLKDGMQATASGLNVMIGFNDGRKFISELRHRIDLTDYRVVSYRLPDRRKVYRLEANPQQNLFVRKEGINE